jgi:hypothetical protein
MKAIVARGEIGDRGPRIARACSRVRCGRASGPVEQSPSDAVPHMTGITSL